jgi:hypothetical protein
VQHPRVALELADQPDVAAEHVAPLLDRRRSGIRTPGGDRGDAREQPRVAHRAAPDHHGVAAGGLADALEAGHVDDVAVADHRDVGRHRGADQPDDLEIGVAGEALGAGAAVDGDHPRAGLDQRAGELGRVPVLVSQPARCLTVTGTSGGTASTTARTRRCATSGSRISAEPHSPATTRLAGQPMLMSTSDAPIDTAICAAIAIGPSSRPKICTPNCARRGWR